MILNFSIKNFYSFKDEVTVDLVNKKVVSPESFIKIGQDKWVNKVAIFYGANASGKTNLLKGLAFLQYFLVDSYHNKVDAENQIMPFAFGNIINESSFLKLKFFHNKKIKTYELKISFKDIYEEKFYEGDKLIFLREKDKIKNNEISEKNLKINLRKNVSFLSHIMQLGSKKAKSLWNYFGLITNSNINWLNRVELINDAGIIQAAKNYYKNKEMKKFAEEIIKKYDYGISKLGFMEMIVNNKVIPYAPVFEHGENNPLSFKFESQGTLGLYVHAVKIYHVLKNGGILIMDELEKDLHPDIIKEIVELFQNPLKNPNNAQLIASTHSTPLLDELNKEEIFFVEKKNNASEVYGLKEFEEVDNYADFYKYYSSGAFGATPEIEPFYPFDLIKNAKKK